MLDLRHICHHYAGRLLLDHLSLQIPAGEVVALLGASGSGKSTLLRIAAGLEAPDSGEVWWGSENLSDVPPERRGFALMFQDFALFPHLNIEDNVAFGLVEQGMRRREARSRARDMLAVFGLKDRAAESVLHLSGGEQQRVALARALITRPRALLLDEPFSALDADLRLRLQAEFAQRIRDAGMATLLVTHDESEARTLAPQAWRLGDGRLSRAW